MFENCNTLLDLNRTRMDLVRANPSALEGINREYQLRREELLNSTPKYVRLQAKRPNVVDKQLIMGITYLGPCDKELTLKYTKKGFIC